MLTKLEHRMLKYCSYFISITQTFPFSWNTSSFLQISTTRSVWEKCVGLLNLALAIGHVGFLVVRLIPGIGPYTEDEYNTIHYSLVIHIFSLNAFNCVLVMQLGAIRGSAELADLINQILNIRIRQDKNEEMAFAPPNRREKIIYGLAAYFAMICMVFLPGLNLIIPRSKHTIYSALPPAWQNHFTLGLTVGLELWSWTRAMLENWITFYTGYAYILINYYWLNKLSTELLANQGATLQAKFGATYHTLVLLNTMYNNGFASILFPVLKSGLELGAMLCLFAALRFHDSINVYVYIFFIVCGPFLIAQPATAIVFMSGVYEKATELEFNYRLGQVIGFPNTSGGTERDRRHAVLLKRIMTSCRPIYCRVGSLFFVEKSTKLAYISLLINAFVQVLLTTTEEVV